MTGCPQKGGTYEAHTATNYGDVCRNAGKAWNCPIGCSRTPAGAAPYCTLTATNRPCRGMKPGPKHNSKQNGWSKYGVAALSAMSGMARGTVWDAFADGGFEADWILQHPPKEHWGQKQVLSPGSVCSSGPNCNTDFKLRLVVSICTVFRAV